jgi:hypothetical protein
VTTRGGKAMPLLTGLVLGVVVVTLGACMAVPPPPAPPPDPPRAPLLTVEHWQMMFDRDAPGVDRDSRPLSRSTDSWDFYSLAHSLDAFTGMFEATGESRYADTALDFVEGMMASARPAHTLPQGFDDNYLGWATEQPGSRGQEVSLYESYCWRYVTRLLRVLRMTSLYDNPAYRARYDRALAFSETHIFEKWYTRGVEEFVYRSRTHMAAHWAYIALDLAEITSSADRHDRYLEVVRSIDDGLPNYPSSLRTQLRPSTTDPVAYVWSDVWGAAEPPQDVSHGNGVMAYVVEARDLDAGWSSEELARFTRTLTSFVIGDDGRYPEFVDGTGEGNGWIADGFVKLGRFDPAVQSLLEEYGVQNAQYYAAMAANAKILGARGDG